MVEVLAAHDGLVRLALLGGEAGGVAQLVVGVVLERAGHGVGGGVAVLAVGGRDGELAGGRSRAEGLVGAVHSAGPSRGAGLVGDEAHALAEGVREGDGLGAAVEGLTELGGRLVIGTEVDAPVHAGAAGVGVGAPLGEGPLAVLRTHDTLAIGRGDLSHDAVGSHGRGAGGEDLGRDHEGESGAVEICVALGAEVANRVSKGAGDIVGAQLAGPDLDVAAGDRHGEGLGLAGAEGGEAVAEADGEGVAGLRVSGPAEAEARVGPEGESAVNGCTGAVHSLESQVRHGDSGHPALCSGRADREEGEDEGDEEGCCDCQARRCSCSAHVTEHKNGPGTVSSAGAVQLLVSCVTRPWPASGPRCSASAGHPRRRPGPCGRPRPSRAC